MCDLGSDSWNLQKEEYYPIYYKNEKKYIYNLSKKVSCI